MLAIGLSFVLASRRVPVPEIIAAEHRVIHNRVGCLAELDKWWQRCSGSTSAFMSCKKMAFMFLSKGNVNIFLESLVDVLHWRATS